MKLSKMVLYVCIAFLCIEGCRQCVKDANANAQTARVKFVVHLGNMFSLDASQSYARRGSLASYKWVQLEGQHVAMPTPNDVKCTILFVTTGLYRFGLTVTDNTGHIGRDTLTVNVLK